jgi:hypothetical protein
MLQCWISGNLCVATVSLGLLISGWALLAVDAPCAAALVRGGLPGWEGLWEGGTCETVNGHTPCSSWWPGHECNICENDNYLHYEFARYTQYHDEPYEKDCGKRYAGLCQADGTCPKTTEVGTCVPVDGRRLQQ